MFDEYKVCLRFTRPVLGTNPIDPKILDTHIIEKQRSLILEKSKINKEVNKYLDAAQITDERKAEEIDKLFDRLENLTGEKYNAEERREHLLDGLEKLKETFKNLDMKGMTVFYRDPSNDLPSIGDHMILGFLKAATDAIAKTLPKKNATILQSKAYTYSTINQHVRVKERFINFDKDIMKTASGAPEYLQRSLRAETAQGPKISLAKSEQIPAGASIQFTLKVMKNSPIKRNHLEQLFSYGCLSGIGQWRNSGYGQFEVESFEVTA